VKDADKESVFRRARIREARLRIISTSGTAEALVKAKIKVKKVFKLHEDDPTCSIESKTRYQLHYQHAERQNPARTRSDDSQTPRLRKKFRS